MATQLEIYNQAADLLGQPNLTVVNPNPGNELSRKLNNNWHTTAKYCLERTSYHFAMKRLALSRVLPAPTFGFAYYYQKPADMVRLVWIGDANDNEFTRMGPHTYREESGKYATNAEELRAIWVTADGINAPGRWTETFGRLVACNLAMRLAHSFNTASKDDIVKELQRVEKQSVSLDAVQQTQRRRRPGTWSTANRRLGTGGGDREQS